MGVAQARSHWDGAHCGSTIRLSRLAFPFANLNGLWSESDARSRRPARGVVASTDSAQSRGEMGREHSEIEFMLAGLTAKQREVLDLLIEHKTSKEIARELGISPHTVDQRIQFAKEKLGANSRSEVALLYRRLIEICGQLTYEDSCIAAPADIAESSPGTQAGPLSALTRRERAYPAQPRETEADYPVVPELFEGRYGTLIRLGAIIAIAVFLVILVLGGLAIFSQLSELMAA
jgi:DNA-binding CsgD family transcriptional regulator